MELHVYVTGEIKFSVVAGFPVFLFPALLDHLMSFCCCTELLDLSVGAIHTK